MKLDEKLVMPGDLTQVSPAPLRLSMQSCRSPGRRVKFPGQPWAFAGITVVIVPVVA